MSHDTHDAHDAHADEHGHEEEHIHMPDPSWAPVTLALGMGLLGFGLIWVSSLPGLIAVFLGVAITIAGLGGWIYEDIKKPGVH